MAKVQVIGIGALNIDRIYRVDSIIVDGEQLVRRFESFPGGSAANTIYCLAKLGTRTGFIGAVGAEQDGNELMKSFQSVGVNTTQIKIKTEMPTGSALCFSDKLGRRALYILPGANSLLRTEDIELGYLKQAHIIHLSSFVNDEQLKIQKDLVKRIDSSTKISLAPGMLYASRGLKTLGSILDRTHILFANRDEIEILTGKDFKAGAHELLKLGCHVVVVTLGSGIARDEAKSITCYICDGQKEYQIESSNLKSGTVIETTGAGDAFAAGFLFGLLKNRNINECGALGTQMAHFAIRRTGARKGLPTLSQLTQSHSQITGNKL